MQLHPLFFAVALLAAPLPALAQATSNPIATSAPVAPWSLVLEDVVRIPDSSVKARERIPGARTDCAKGQCGPGSHVFLCIDKSGL